MIIDSHEHVMLPTTMQIHTLDEAGVDKAILFTTTPHIERAKSSTLEDINNEMQTLYKVLAGYYTPQERIAKMKETIAELQQAISVVPDRFYGFGPVPLGLTENETSDWVDTYVIKNSFKGIGEFTPGSEDQVKQLEVVFQAASNYIGVPVWVHTFNPVTLSGINILMSLCGKYPSVPVIFGHLGGSNWMDVIAFAKDHENAYLDLSAAFTSISVKTALTELPERCLFSSDAPFGEPKLYRDLIEFVSPSTEVTNMALGDNIAKLLKI